ncbi:MAG: ABC transporter ATP-binding protein [Chlamydiota bacterium]|nr:ABC transporter ATP-binding protein [Chlamydiota bacterium]
MKAIRLQSISKMREGSHVIRKLSLEIPPGEFFALLGPSGCGKTTLLRLIAGLEVPDEGNIYLGNGAITHLPVHQRSVNVVFQNYALFPHLSVFENIAYSLRVAHRSQEEIEERVMKMVKIFHLEKLIFALPGRLSGGQQQRVAIARAIINEPSVLLLDEPLAALDFKLREKILVELIDLQDKLKTTFVYVTHDQFEALTVADKMAIMNAEGEIEQIGTPKAIYEFPLSPFVAQFVGTTNLFSGNLIREEGKERIDIPHLGKFLVDPPPLHEGRSAAVVFILRPEKIWITKTPREGFSNTLMGIVSQIVYYGRSTQYTVTVNHQFSFTVFEQNEEHFPTEEIDYEDRVYLQWQKENSLLLWDQG